MIIRTDPSLRDDDGTGSQTTGLLNIITDVIGIQSVFGYQGLTNSVNSLRTPYGETTFLTGFDPTRRWIEITDPEGGKERIEFRNSAPINGSDPVFPNLPGIVNANLNVANTFYWDKKAMIEAPGDYTKAMIKHWLFNPDGTVSGIKSSEKKPLENRVWYTYEGQPDYQHVGTHASPSQVARVLSDNTIQRFEYLHNALGKTTRYTDPLNRVTTYFYDSNGIDLLEVHQTRNAITEDVLRKLESYVNHRPQTVYDASNRASHFEYNEFGQILSRTDQNGEITAYTYYSNGRLKTIDAPSGTTEFVYDEYGRVKDRTYKEDEYTVTTFYDALDRKTQVVYPDGTHEDFGYLQNTISLLDLTTSTDRQGHLTTRHYNGNRQIDSITDPAGTVQYGWCICGSLTRITTDPFSTTPHVTEFTRDLQNRTISKTIGGSLSMTSAYDPATGRLASTTDAMGQVTTYQYYADNNVSQVSYLNAHNATPTVNYVYDEHYNRIHSVTAGGNATTYEYYELTPPVLGSGKVQTITGTFPSHTIGYSYDKVGRVMSRTVDGVTETTTFDSADRVSAIDNDVLGHFDQSYVGGTSRLDQITYPNGQHTQYLYFGNEKDRRLQTIANVSATENLSQFDYDYDSDGQITYWSKWLDSSSSAVQQVFGYDGAKRLTSAQNAVDPNDVTQELDYVYDPSGNRTQDRVSNPSLPYSNEVIHTYGINTANQITTRQTSGFEIGENPDLFVWDANGNLRDDGTGRSFEWDAANRLIAINYLATGNRTEFAYDGLGRRVKQIEYGPGVTTEVQPRVRYTAYNAGPFTLPAGECTITFQGLNPNGGDNTSLIDAVTMNNVLVANGSFQTPNLIATGTPEDNYRIAPTGNAWSFFGVAGIAANGSTFGSPATTDGTQAGFIKNHGSISQTINLPSSGSYTLSFKASQLNGNDSWQQVRVILRTESSATETKTFVWCENNICEERHGSDTKMFFANGEQRIGAGAGIYYYTRDHQGSIREVTEQGGGVLAQYDYDPYGNRVVIKGKMDFDFGYTGHYYHAPSALKLTLYRAYNSSVGRWISRDPIGEADGLNLYAYVSNDPVNRVDRNGLCGSKPQIKCWPVKIGPGSAGCYSALTTCNLCCAGKMQDWADTNFDYQACADSCTAGVARCLGAPRLPSMP